MENKASAPPVDAAYYHREKLANKGDSVEQIAKKLGISVEQAQEYESQLSAIISNAKEEMRIAEKNLTSDRNSSLGIEQSQAPRDPNNPLHFGGRKSRRHAKKSRRHAKKSRRHAKKSRRHAKKSRRHAKKSRR
jgi:transcriptional regulator with XRE-family HTH domain